MIHCDSKAQQIDILFLCERVMNKPYRMTRRWGIGSAYALCMRAEEKETESVRRAQPCGSGWYIDHSCRAVRAMVAPCDMSALTHMSPITQWTTLVGRMIDGMSLNDQVIAWIGYVLRD